MSNVGASLAEHFAAVEDPRAGRLTDYKLVMIAIFGVTCGAETCTDIE
jgi:hypothetical protein